MNPFVKLWFWLLILSIIGYLIAFSGFETVGQSMTNQLTPIWVWIVLGLSFAASIAALVLYCIEAYREIKQRKIDIACGKIPPPQPEKIECPVVNTPCATVTPQPVDVMNPRTPITEIYSSPILNIPQNSSFDITTETVSLNPPLKNAQYIPHNSVQVISDGFGQVKKFLPVTAI